MCHDVIGHVSSTYLPHKPLNWISNGRNNFDMQRVTLNSINVTKQNLKDDSWQFGKPQELFVIKSLYALMTIHFPSDLPLQKTYIKYIADLGALAKTNQVKRRSRPWNQLANQTSARWRRGWGVWGLSRSHRLHS